MHHIVLYMKPGCHLCHNATEMLRDFQRRLPFTFSEVDITLDAGLYDRFREEIPVVEFNGRVLLSAPIGPATAEKVLTQHLTAAERRSP